MPVSRPPPPSHRVPGNCLSGVGCGVPYDGLTHGDLAGGEVAGSTRVVRVDVKHDALSSAWCQLVLGFGSPQVTDGTWPWPSPSIGLSLAVLAVSSYRHNGGP